MAVSFVSTTHSFNSGAGTHLTSVTAPAGSDRVLIVSFGLDGPLGLPPAPTDVKYDGTSPTYTLATDTQTNGSSRGFRIHSYAWLESDLPAAGAYDVSITTTATIFWTSTRACFFTGVNQGPISSSIAKKGGTPAPSSTVSGPGSLVLGTAGGLVMDHVWQFYGDVAIAPDAGQTLRGTVNNVAGAIIDGTSTKVSVVGTNNMSWTNTSWGVEMQICMLTMFGLLPPYTPPSGGLLLGFNH